jgi:type IV pilus assembly protein PilM
MEFPVMSEKEIGQAVPYEAKQHVPIPLTEVILDWQTIGTVKKNEGIPGQPAVEKTLVLLVAVPQEVVNKYKRIAKLAGLDLYALELETLGMIRSVVGGEKTPMILVDIGGRSTNINVVDGGALRMSHSIDTSGADITQAISHGFNVNLLRAEAIKKERGIIVAPGEEDLKTLITTLLDVIIAEIERISGLYLRRYGVKTEKIVLCGGTSNLPGLLDYFKDHFRGQEVLLGNAFGRLVFPDVLTPLVPELSPVFATAIGLAMREII